MAATGRFLVGFGSAFAFVGVLKLATIWLPEDKLALISGLATALGTIGAMIGDNLLGVMVYQIGWEPTVYLSGLFGIVLTLLLWWGIKDQKDIRQQRGDSTITNLRKNLKALSVIVKNGQIWINGLYGCLVYLPITVFAELWGIPYLHNAYGIPEAQAHFANSLLFLGFTFGAPSMGFISDRIHRRKSPMLVGASGSALIMMCILYIPNLPITFLYVLMILLGFLSSSQAIIFAVGRELSATKAAGTAIATTNMIVMIGAMVLQPTVGALLDFSSKRYAEINSEVIPQTG